METRTSSFSSAGLDVQEEDESVQIRNQLTNLCFEQESDDTTTCSLYDVWHRLPTKVLGLASTLKARVHAVGREGGMLRTKWVKRITENGSKIEEDKDEELFPSATWTKVTVCVTIAQRVAPGGVEDRRAEALVVSSSSATTNVSLCFFSQCKRMQVMAALDVLDVGMLERLLRAYQPNLGKLRSKGPRAAMVVFAGYTDLSVARLDTPALIRERQNPCIWAPNRQRVTSGGLLEIVTTSMSSEKTSTATADWKAMIRLRPNGSFNIFYTLCDGSEALQRLWTADSPRLGSALLRYIKEKLRKRELVMRVGSRNATSAQVARSGTSFTYASLRNLPLLNDVPYQKYKSKQLSRMYAQRMGFKNPPKPPEGKVWVHKRKKLYMYMGLVGLLDRIHDRDALFFREAKAPPESPP